MSDRGDAEQRREGKRIWIDYSLFAPGGSGRQAFLRNSLNRLERIVMRFGRTLRALQVAVIVVAGAGVDAQFQRAHALITGGVGKDPIDLPGLPSGAASLFNGGNRIAWWEGPPFGGGQYHAECRGDTAALNQALIDFAKLDVKTKRLVVKDGIGQSFWINPNHEPEKQADANMDWRIMVWSPDSWQRLRKLPTELNPTDPKDAETGPPAQIEVYTGGGVQWDKVVVPEGIEIIDQRLEAHGYTAAFGEVLEGTVVDLGAMQPISAKILLQYRRSQPQGGYQYLSVAETVADDQGRWVLRQDLKGPNGPYRIVVESPGYAPRVAGHPRLDDQPSWQSFDCGLSAIATISGRVADEAGKPLDGAKVVLRGVSSSDGGRYESPNEFAATTDSEGRFEIGGVPTGKGRVTVSKPGYYGSGLGQSIEIPADELKLQLNPSATVIVTVDFEAVARPQAYLVDIEPEGGSKVGSWGGSARIDDANSVTFNNVPPGRYTIQGHPNPTSDRQKTVPVTIELKGGQRIEVEITAN